MNIPTSIPDWRRTAPPGVSLASLVPSSVPVQAAGTAATAEVPLAMQPILRPEVMGRWAGWAAKDYTPERVEAVLRGMSMGDHESGWELLFLMEDTWPTLAKAVAELKRAAVQLDWDVEPWAEDDEPASDMAKERAKLVSHALWKMRPRPEEGANGFQATLMDLLDAWFKGVSVLEVEWEVRDQRGGGQAIFPKQTHWVHPRHYAWGADGRLALRASGDGARRDRAPITQPFPADQFLIGVCKSRSGPILSGALLRPLAWWWCAANFSAGWLLNLAQIFGLPIRWASYAPNTPAATVSAICGMLENMGSSAWAAFPAGTNINLIEPAKSSGTSPQDGLLDRADHQALLLVLGQGLTTQVGDSGSRALGDVHKSVRDEIVQAAADWAASVLNEQLVPAILRLNYGDEEEAPEICAEPSEQTDLKAEADRLNVLLPHLPVSVDWIYRSQKIPKPQAGEATIGGAGTPATPGPGISPVPARAVGMPAAEVAPAVTARRTPGVEPHPLPDTPAKLAAAAAPALASAFRGALAPVRALLAESGSRAEFERRLQAHYADWKPERVAAVVEQALQVSAAAGAGEGFPN